MFYNIVGRKFRSMFYVSKLFVVVRPHVLETVPLLYITEPIISSLVLYINILTE